MRTRMPKLNSPHFAFGILIICVIFNLFALDSQAQITVAGSTTEDGTYTTLGAAFAAINAVAQTGNTIAITVTANTSESGGATLNAGAWTSITIQPSGGSWTISEARTAGNPLIDLSGADNVNIDGLNSGGNALTISNTTSSATAGTCTIRFIGGASNNTITRCTIKGAFSATVATDGGNIYFATDAVASTGNDNNTISYCDICPEGAGTTSKCIYGNGTTTNYTTYNSGNTITNNNIFDFWADAVASAGIYVGGGCTDWNITNNKFYQTGARTQSAGSIHSAIELASANNNNMIVTGNTIGYAASGSTGTYSFTGFNSSSKFFPIYISASGATAADQIDDNTITAISVGGAISGSSTSGTFAAIMYAGGGTDGISISNNTIGSTSISGDIAFSSSSSSSSSLYGIYNNAAFNSTFSGNTIGGITATNSSTGPISFNGIILVPQSTNVNLILNNTIGYPAAPITLTTSSANTQGVGIFIANGAAKITGNIVRNITSNSANTGIGGAISLIGIYTSSLLATHQTEISSNSIHSLSNTASAGISVCGILNVGSSVSTNVMDRNLIYGLSVSDNTAFIYGIYTFTGNPTYKNNMIRLGIDDTGVGINVGCSINGIITGAGNAYFNSIYVGGAPTAGSSNTFCLKSTVTTTRLYENNILWNARNNAGATGINYAITVAGTTPNPAGLTCDYNDLYTTGSGGVTGLFNSTDYASLSAWQTATGADNHSFSADPSFTDVTSGTPDLHITGSTPIEGAAIAISGITTDYDQDDRSSNTPSDIGADAGNFPITDLSGPAIVYTLLSTPVFCTSNRTISATITDATGVDVNGGTKPRIWFKKSTNSDVLPGTNDNTTDGWKYAEASNSSSPFSLTIDVSLIFGGLAGAETVQYFVVAQDLSGTPLLSIASSVPASTQTSVAFGAGAFPMGGFVNSYTTVAGGLSGTVTIGSAGTYTSLTKTDGLFAAINAAGLTGDLTATIMDGTVSEDGATALNAISYGCAGPYTFTINTAVPTTLSGSRSDALIRLNACDYVVINGSVASVTNTVCPYNVSSRDMTITNTNSGTSSAVIWLKSNSTDGATNNTIENCILQGNSNTTTLFGVGSGSSTISTTSLGVGNNNNSYINNTISKTQYGIFSEGAGAGSKNTGTVINLNQINTVSPDNVSKGGILVGYEDNITISGNSISEINISTAIDAIGISVGAGTSLSSSAMGTNEVSNANITHNTIGTITQSLNLSAVGIALCASTSGTSLVANNMISGVNGNAASGDFAAGLYLGGGQGSTTNVYYNTVKMQGAFTSGTYPSFGLAVLGSNPTINLNNNILISSGSTGANLNRAMGFNYTNFSNLTSNNNNLYATGTGSAMVQSTNLTSSGNVSYSTLSAWNSSSAKDAASLNIDPVFISSTDLHIDNSNNANITLNAGGAVLTTTDDIDCGTRDVATPDIGADEFIICSGTPAAGTISPTTYSKCETQTLTISATGADIGGGITYQWQVGTVSGGPYSNVSGGTGATTVSYTSAALTAGIYYYVLKTTCAGSGLFAYSNEATVTVYTNSVVVAATTAASVCNGVARNLYADGGSELSFDGVNDYVEVANASSLNAFPLTVSALVKTSSAGTGNYGIVSKYLAGSYNGYNLFMSGGHVYAFYFADNSNYCFDFGGGSHAIDGGLINDNLWHQIAMTVDAGGLSIYVDGILKDSQAWTGTAAACTTTQPLFFGRYGTGYFTGEMDEVRFWNTAQSASTLLANMNLPVATNASNLSAYWRLDNGAGVTTTDITGNGNTGTLKNGITWVSPSTAPINTGMTYVWSPATGLSGTTGSSVTANPGSDQTYTVTGTATNGCSATTTVAVTLHSNPTVTLSPFSDVCSTASSSSLTGGSPLGGEYSGTGVTDDIFNPAVSGAGTFPVTYTYTDGNACTNTATQPLTTNYTSACVPTTALAAGYQNITLTALNDRLYFDWISGSTNYDVNVTNTSLGYDQTYTTGSATIFRMTNFSNIAYGTVYNVKVRAKVNGVYGAYGTIYTVTTSTCPTTQLATGYCNSTVSTLNDHLYFDNIPGASNYDINVVNTLLSYDQTITIGATNVFRMTNFTGIVYSTVYDVKVRVKINGVYGAYGSTCTITTPAPLTTQLASGYCNITLPAMSNNLYYDWVPDASNYDINVVNTGLSYDQTITKGATTNFRMTNFPGMVANTIYDVKVRAKINGVYGAYGSVCTVTTPISLARSGAPDSPPQEGAGGGISLSAFPNPFTENINILFTSDETSPAQLNIYDLAGRNIYTYKNFPINVKTQCIASLHLQPGLYFAEIVQGTTKTVQRIVKTN